MSLESTLYKTRKARAAKSAIIFNPRYASKAHHADNVARICAEHEREYQEAHDALRQAREKLAEAMQCVVDCIGSLRDMASAGLVNANEWNSLCDQLAEYGEAFDQARDNALETLAKANRWYDIDWRDCAP